MSKTNFTAQTETIDTNYDMLNYYYFDNIFTSSQIKDIIKICENLGTETVTADYNGPSNDDKRRTQVGYLPINKDNTWIYEKIYGLSMDANQEMGWNFDIDGIGSSIEYSIHGDNGGHYQWSSDISKSNTNKLSVTIHLSTDEEYTGGKTEFNNGLSIIKPTFNIGDMVVTPSYLLQRVTPILTGVRRTLTLTITGNPFK